MSEQSKIGFGRRNPHCSNCGDERGGPFGHEISECKYWHGMTAADVAELLPKHRRDEFWDAQIDRYFAHETARAAAERERRASASDTLALPTDPPS